MLSANVVGSGTDRTNPSLIKIEDVLKRTGLGRTLLYELIGQDAFPEPVKIGRKSCWVEYEVIAWIDEQIFRRNSGRQASQHGS